MAEDRRAFGITRDWSTTALDPGVCTLQHSKGVDMVVWVSGEKKAFDNRQRKRRGGHG